MRDGRALFLGDEAEPRPARRCDAIRGQFDRSVAERLCGRGQPKTFDEVVGERSFLPPERFAEEGARILDEALSALAAVYAELGDAESRGALAREMRALRDHAEIELAGVARMNDEARHEWEKKFSRSDSMSSTGSWITDFLDGIFQCGSVGDADLSVAVDGPRRGSRDGATGASSL